MNVQHQHRTFHIRTGVSWRRPSLVTTDASIATVVLTRPDFYNAFDLDAIEEIADALLTLGADDAVRAVVVTGAGRAFCAGGDLRWAAASRRRAGRVPPAGESLSTSPSRRSGACRSPSSPRSTAGCRRRLLARARVRPARHGESAVLKQAYTSSGLCLDGASSWTLPRLVGLARALEIVASDPVISARQAESWGLATRVVPDGDALTAAQALARELARGSVSAFAACKQLLTDAFDSALESQLERERSAISGCAAHADGIEGLAAFVAKRKPQFGSR
jgi:2-(1,2-epoxy-1,2-dihydrophenyl)acetyl-CoA isomerase